MRAAALNLPFFRGNDFDNARLHPVFVDLVDELLEAPKLVHCLHGNIVSTNSSHKYSQQKATHRAGFTAQSSASPEVGAYRLEDGYFPAIEIMIRLDFLVVVAIRL